MLVSGSRILDVAHENDFAVPAFNISDWQMLRGVIDTCEEMRAPVLIAIHPNELRHVGDSFVSGVLDELRRASVPTALHFDHGADLDQMLWAVRTGFTSAMLDGSMLDFEQNVALTSSAVEMAHSVGMSAEGELGTIGRTDLEAEDGAATIVYTDPAAAVEFVERTGVDFLAVAIGTSHGIYPDWMKPELKLDLLREIKEAVDIPLVLHGGSNNPDDEIRTAASIGVNKINISSDIKVAYHAAMRDVLQDRSKREPHAIQPRAVAAMQEVAAHKLRLFGTDGKADLF